MAPDHIHLIRHGEGYHNLRVENHQVRDPTLTPKGEHQCTLLRSCIQSDPDGYQIDCIIASPMRRTLYTALRVFKPTLLSHPDLKILAVPEFQETSALPCDTGLSADELQKEFIGQPVDFSFVTEGWNNKTSGPFASRSDVIDTRARNARQFLQSRQEKEVAVVTHGAFLHFLTEDWAGSRTGCGTGWANCDMRSYTLLQQPTFLRGPAHLHETEQSLNRRKHQDRPLTKDEQLEIAVATQRSWAEDGFIVIPGTIITPQDSTVQYLAEPVIATKIESTSEGETKAKA